MTADREEIAALLFEHVNSTCTEGFGYSDTDTREERMRGCLHLADALADLLAARDRRVRAEALREAARDLPTWEAGNEVRAYTWLRDRAGRIEGDA